MGLFKNLKKALGYTREEARILVLGLDNSGKTTLINHIKPKKAATFEVTPTVGYSVEEFTKNNLNFTILDMSGSSHYRSLWSHYYSSISSIIFVIDSTDKLRMCVVKEELDLLLDHPDLKNRSIPILFFSNKMDVPGSLTPVECMQQLSLDRITNKAWHITSSNALSGVGVDEGVGWLAEKLLDRGEEEKSSRK